MLAGAGATGYYAQAGGPPPVVTEAYVGTMTNYGIGPATRGWMRPAIVAMLLLLWG